MHTRTHAHTHACMHARLHAEIADLMLRFVKTGDGNKHFKVGFQSLLGIHTTDYETRHRSQIFAVIHATGHRLRHRLYFMDYGRVHRTADGNKHLYFMLLLDTTLRGLYLVWTRMLLTGLCNVFGKGKILH